MSSRLTLAILSGLLSVSVGSQSAPVITAIQINPTPLENIWIAPAPVKGSNLSATVAVSMSAVDFQSTDCTSFGVGVLINGQCLQASTGLFQIKGIFPSSAQSSCVVTSQSSAEPLRAVAKQNLDFSLKKGASNVDLTFCAYNSAQHQITSASYKASYGDPVTRVNVTAATFSNSTRILTVSGNVVPNGRNDLNGIPVDLYFPAAQPIKTKVNGRRFAIQQEVSSNPQQLQALVLNRFSANRKIRVVR